MNYAVIIKTRNDASFLYKTLKCVVEQNLKSKYILVVNDGSTDATQVVMRYYQEKYPELIHFTRKDRGYSALGTYEMADVLNDGYLTLIHYSNWDFLMVLDSDTYIPPHYVETVIGLMGDCYGVASGRLEGRKPHPHHVSDTGQIIRRDLLDELGGFPRTYAWNIAILPFSRMKGFKTRAFLFPPYNTLREDNKGSGRSYIGWGKGMRDSGYYPPLAIGRIAKIMLKGHPLQSLRMLWGYTFHRPMLKQEWMDYNRKEQKDRLKNGIKKLFRIN